MTILIGRYEFDGPYKNAADLEDKEGIYAVLHYEDRNCELIQVAHAQNIREQLERLQSAYAPPAGKFGLRRSISH